MLQAMDMMSGGPPGMRMEPPSRQAPGISQEEQLGMAQQRAAMMVQQEERAKHLGDPRSMEEQELLEQRRGAAVLQELLEQQKRAAVLLEHERQQQMAKIHAGLPGPEMGARPPMMSAMPPGNPMRGMDPRGPLPPGVNMMPSQRQRVAPPPGEDGRKEFLISWSSATVFKRI